MRCETSRCCLITVSRDETMSASTCSPNSMDCSPRFLKLTMTASTDACTVFPCGFKLMFPDMLSKLSPYFRSSSARLLKTSVNCSRRRCDGSTRCCQTNSNRSHMFFSKLSTTSTGSALLSASAPTAGAPSGAGVTSTAVADAAAFQGQSALLLSFGTGARSGAATAGELSAAGFVGWSPAPGWAGTPSSLATTSDMTGSAPAPSAISP
mmetsp:Transcript_82814/g.208560  ORF Transcript_82814/g.208560 Transcript_82814/m.208560 type:complete len:209 (+) Transcript_82814:1639-2265(+)